MSTIYTHIHINECIALPLRLFNATRDATCTLHEMTNGIRNSMENSKDFIAKDKRKLLCAQRFGDWNPISIVNDTWFLVFVFNLISCYNWRIDKNKMYSMHSGHWTTCATNEKSSGKNNHIHRESKKDFELNTRILCICFVIKSATGGSARTPKNARTTITSVWRIKWTIVVFNVRFSERCIDRL